MGDKGTTRRRRERDGRSDAEHKSEVDTVVVEQKRTVPQVTEVAFVTY